MSGEHVSTAGLTEVCRSCCAHLARIERAKQADAELIARSRSALSTSYAILTRVPELSFTGQPLLPWPTDPGPPAVEAEVPWSLRAWVGFEARDDRRFFFDVDDGEVLRRDEVGLVLSSQDDVPGETRSILFDSARAAIPEGRPRLFTARVRNTAGKCVYEGSVRMKPLPTRRHNARKS